MGSVISGYDHIDINLEPLESDSSDGDEDGDGDGSGNVNHGYWG